MGAGDSGKRKHSADDNSNGSDKKPEEMSTTKNQILPEIFQPVLTMYYYHDQSMILSISFVISTDKRYFVKVSDFLKACGLSGKLLEFISILLR